MTPQPTIELVTSPGCTKCAAVRSTIHHVLQDISAEYTEIDLTEHPEYARDYHLLSAPAVIINGQLEFHGRVSATALRHRLSAIQNGDTTETQSD
jgi:glutaredoxin